MTITAENLNNYVSTLDVDSLRNLLRQMTDAERTELRDSIDELISAQNRCFYSSHWDSEDDLAIALPDQFAMVKVPGKTLDFKSLNIARANLSIIYFYCCDLSLLGTRSHMFSIEPKVVADILIERKFQGAAKWCRKILKDSHYQFTPVAIALELRNYVKLSHDSRYYYGLAAYLNQLTDPLGEMASGRWSKEEVVEFFFEPLIYRIFAEMGGKVKFKRMVEGLVESGYFSQEDLNKLLMELLVRNSELWVKPFSGWDDTRINFIVDLNESLSSAKSASVEDYVALCGANNTKVATYVIGLFQTEKLAAPDARVLAANLLPNFINKDKEPAIRSVQLLTKLYEEGAIEAKDYAEKACSAFLHKTQEVHEKTLKALDKSKVFEQEGTAESLVNHLDLLKPANKLKAKKILDKAAFGVVPVSQDSVSKNAISEDDAELSELLQSLNSSQGREFEHASGLLSLSEEIHKGQNHNWQNSNAVVSAILAVVDFYNSDYPRVEFNSSKLSTVETIEDMAHLVKQSLSGNVSQAQVELLLESMARLWSWQNGNFQDIRQSILTGHLDQASSMFSSSSFSMLPALIETWLKGKDEISLKVYYPRLLSERILGLICRMSEGLTLPMLAAPTHEGGWIDPATFVQRVLQYQKHGRLLIEKPFDKQNQDIFRLADQLAFCQKYNYAADIVEFNLALLRLNVSPDYNEEISEVYSAKKSVLAFLKKNPPAQSELLRICREVKGDFGRALRYTLGEGKLSEIRNWELAVIAFRARYPLGRLEGISSPVSDMPDCLEPALYRLDKKNLPEMLEGMSFYSGQNYAEAVTARVAGKAYPVLEFEQARNFITDLRIKWSAEQSGLLRCPTSFIHMFYLDLFAPGGELSYLWLNHQEAALARLSRICFGAIHYKGFVWHKDYDFVFDEDLSLAKNGAWLLAIGSFALSPTLRSNTIDLFIAGISHNRCEVNTLTEAYQALLQFKVPGSRMAEVLRETSRASELHALFIMQLCSNLLVQLDAASRVSSELYGVLLDIVDAHKYPVGELLKARLSKVKGSSKSATMAKALLSNNFQWQTCVALKRACSQSIQSRINRCERWQQWRRSNG